MTRRKPKGVADGFMAWIDALRAESDEWKAATPAGTRDRPRVIEAVRRVCLVRTDAGEFGVICHGGWTEHPGEPIGSFTAGYVDGAAWFTDETEARADYQREVAEEQA